MFVAEQKKTHHEISFLLLKLFECSAHKMLYTHQTKTQPVSKTFPRITILIIIIDLTIYLQFACTKNELGTYLKNTLYPFTGSHDGSG